MATTTEAEKGSGCGPRVVVVERNHPRPNLAEQDLYNEWPHLLLKELPEG